MTPFHTDASPLIFDIETAPIANARDFIDPPSLDDIAAPSNYKDEAKIAAYIEDAKAKALVTFERNCAEKAALDFNLARVVALGWWTERHGDVQTALCRDEQDEREAIGALWSIGKHRTLTGFRIREFDLPMLMQRSRLLDVPYPVLDLGRYARGSGVCDLYDILTFNGLRTENIMRQTCRAFAKRFGIAVDDTVAGAEVPSLIAAGDWEAVRGHVMSDVAMTVGLAQRLRIVDAAAMVA
jgi:hypothetical protein